MKSLILALAAGLLCCAGVLAGQNSFTSQVASPANGSTNQSAAQTDKADSSSKTKAKEVPSFLIIGTVFNENALSFPGVQVRIRRKDEKKFRWETYTNSRGDFAVRVPPGYEYEVVSHVKNYQDQREDVDSKVDVQKRISIRLQPKEQKKAGARS